MRHALPLSLIAIALGFSALACNDPSAPAARARSYQLVSYGGAPLPIVLRRIVETSTLPGGPTTYCDDKLTGSTLTLMNAGRFTQADSHLLVCDDGRADAASQAVLQGTYTTGADTAVLSADLGSGASYVELARMTDGGLVIYRRSSSTAGGATSTDPTSLIFANATN